MRIRKLSYIVFFLLLFSPAAQGGEGLITIVYPPDRVIKEFNLINVSIKVVPDSVDMIKLRVNGREKKKISPERKYVCFAVNLELGINTVDIIALRDGRQADSKSLSVFRRSELVARYKDAPEEFRKDNFHTDDHTACAECHRLDPGKFDRKPVSPGSFVARNFEKEAVFGATSTCYSCHREITSSPYVHGPAAVWSCVSCHNPGAEIKYAVKKPDTEVCFSCHTDKQKEWERKKYIHGPVNIGKCAICHSPHSSDNPFNLFKPVWELCTNCHFEKGTGRHVLGDSFSTEGHPTRDKKDPLREGKELSCASCHNPHASDFPHLWALNAQGTFDLCLKCHYDKVNSIR